MNEKGFELIWEAIHPDAEGFAGSLVDLERSEAVLFYPGAAHRKGGLFWQRAEVKAPVEVQCVRFREDEAAWSTELGADVDLSQVVAEDVYNALEVRPLGWNQQTILMAYRIEESRWVLLGLNRTDGAVRWSREIYEPHASQLNSGGSLFVAGDLEGQVCLIRVDSGEVVANLDKDVEHLDAIWAEDAVLLARADGTVVVFGTDGYERWSCPLVLAETDRLEDRILVEDHGVILVSNGELCGRSLKDGSLQWRQQGPGSGHVALADVGDAFVVQDISTNKSTLHRGCDGTPIPVEGFDELLHWISGPEEVFAVTVDGAFAAVDLKDGGIRHAEPLPDGLRLFDLVCEKDRLLATGMTTAEDPLVLTELAGDGCSVLRKEQLPVGGQVRLELGGSGEVVVTSPLGVLIYA